MRERGVPNQTGHKVVLDGAVNTPAFTLCCLGTEGANMTVYPNTGFETGR